MREATALKQAALTNHRQPTTSSNQVFFSN